MKTLKILLVLLLLFAAPVFADYKMDVEFKGECPPDNTVELSCTDIGSGTVYVSQTINLDQQYTFMIPENAGTVVCIVECNGKEVYRKRYEYPGTPWRAVPDYPHDITRAGDEPSGAFIGTSDSVIIRNADDCGNGNQDPGEGCDTNGNAGCDDPLKPTCYNCDYCGCSDARQCVQISGAMNCGDHGCPPYSYPKFTTLCLNGICAYKRECIIDQDCIDKYIEEYEKEHFPYLTEENESAETQTEQTSEGEAIVEDTGEEETEEESIDWYETHMVCSDYGYCIVAEGTGENECESSGECNETDLIPGQPKPEDGRHTVCKEKMCVSVEGEGEDECQADYECGGPLPSTNPGYSREFKYHTTCQEGKCVSVSGDGLSECLTDLQCALLTTEGKTHSVCSSDGACVQVSGEGEDECSKDTDCKVIDMPTLPEGSHKGCFYRSCTDVPGEGADECSKDSDCEVPSSLTSPFYYKCVAGGECKRILGKGENECSGNEQCGHTTEVGKSDDGVHTACESFNSCVYVDGEGYDECTGDLDCGAAPLPEGYGSAPPAVPGDDDPSDGKHYACAGNQCSLQEGEGEDECMNDAQCREDEWSVLGFDLEQNASIPSPLKDIIGNEKVNLYVEGEAYHVDLENGIVVEGGEGEMEGNTINVITDRETAEAINSGEMSVEEALEQDKIIIEGEGFVEGIKWAILNFLYDIGQMVDI